MDYRNHGLLPLDRVKYRFSTGIVVERGAKSGVGYYVVVEFQKPVKFKRTFRNADILALKKLKK